MSFKYKLPTAGDILVAILVGLLLKAPTSLISNAVTGWVDDAIGAYLGLSSPSVESVVQFAWQWVVPFGAAMLILVVYHHWNTRYRSTSVKGKAVQVLQFEYPNECNSDAKSSLFKRSTRPMSRGGGIDAKLSIHRYYVGVVNTSDKTIRNVKLIVDSISGPGGRRSLGSQFVNAPCLIEGTSNSVVDIPPRRMEYFFIGEGIDSSDAGIFGMTFMEANDYARLMNDIEKRKDFGFLFIAANGRSYPTLSNDGCIMDAVVYGDDVPPTTVAFTVNAKNRIEVLLNPIDGTPRDGHDDPMTEWIRDVWVAEALIRASLGRWTEGMAERASIASSSTLGAQFSDLSFNGALPIWGKFKGANVWSQIPRGFWLDHQIDLTTMSDDPKSVRLRRKLDTTALSDWTELMTTKSVVDFLWRDQKIN